MKTKRLPFGLAACTAFALALAGGQNAQAQSYDPTIRVPVTLYDFHSDRTNPEFEVQHGKYNGNSKEARPNMVDSTLDKDGKPTTLRSSSSVPYLNHGIRFWFRDNSKLNTYQEFATTVTGSGPDNGKKYLDRFRPVYMYTNNNNNNGYPLTWRQTGTDNDNGTEWNASPVTGRGQVPYAYANSEFMTGYTNGTRITTTANGFNMNNQYYAIDSAYKNVVIQDTLIFTHQGNGTYTFVRDKDANQQFFPLDNKGLETSSNHNSRWIYNGRNGDQVPHNYSYTMELVWQFRYDSSIDQTFTFMGDDDVWVFVNGKLVMDIGGIHEQVARTFNLRTLAGGLGLVNNQITDMRMFYSERHSNDANIRITTNIITTKPSEMYLDVDCDTLTAGVPCLGEGYLYDQDGKRIGYDDNGNRNFDGVFTWSARDLGRFNNPPGGDAFVGNTDNPPNNLRDLRVYSKYSSAINKSDSIYLVANKAYTTIRLYGQYCDLANNCVRDSADVYVKAGAPTKLTVEASGDSLTSLRNPAPLAEIVLTASDTTNSNFYAILRDDYGNWVRAAAHGSGGGSNAWTTARTSIATAANGANTARGQGKATRVAATADTTRLTVTHTGSAGIPQGGLTGTSVVRLSDVEDRGIRIGVKINGDFLEIPDGATILMNLPADSTFWIQVRRSDDLTKWVEGPANWLAVVAPNGIGGSAPNSITPGSSYTYSPTAPAEILLIAKTLNGSYADTVRVKAQYNTPVSMRFFNKEGTPTDLNNILTGYPPSDTKHYRYPVSTDPVTTVTAAAGVTVPIYVGMFATNPPSLASYIPNNGVPGSVTWELIGDAGPDTTKVTPSADGFSAEFRSTVAHRTHVVRATYTSNGVTIQQELRVLVVPGAIAAVYIEPESQALNPSSLNKPLTFTGNAPEKDTLYMTEKETSRVVYALLRDKWGNYIAPSGGYYPYWSTYWPNKEPDIKYTEWGPTGEDHAVTAVPGGSPSMGQGLVIKAEGAAGNQYYITAREETFNINSDFVNPYRLPVHVRAYSYTELRVKEKGSHYHDGDSLRITTNDTPELVVEGKRSDCDTEGGPTGDKCWEEVSGNWGPDDGLANSLQPPPPGSSWKLDPRRTGKGNITVSAPGIDEDGKPTTISVSVPTVIKLGPPDRAELVVISSPTKAGEPIQAEVRYYNRTGLMDSWDPSWNSSSERAAFNDDKGLGNTTMKPTIGSDCGSKGLGYSGSQSSANACLAPNPATGRDTVTLTLYNASQNPHTITYTEEINGKKLTASAPITLLPGDPVRVVIIDEGGGKRVGDTLTLDQDKGDIVVLYTVGEDEWGNRTGDESSKWCSNGQIPPSGATCDDFKPSIIYDSREAAVEGCGYVIADPQKNIIGDSLRICVINIALRPVDAITRDFHGCGYINAVEVIFPANVQLENTFDKNRDNNKINLRYDSRSVKFSVSSIKIDSNVVTLVLDENRTSELQTGWKLKLDMDRGLIKNVRFDGQDVRDGAAPVIYTAKRYFDKGGDSKKDYIEVRLSERVRSVKGDLNAATAAAYGPVELFRIWTLDNGMSKVREKRLSKSAKTASVDNNTYKTVSPNPLDGIREVAYVNDSTLRFSLENEADIGPPSHYINILASNDRGDIRSELRDFQTPANIPDTNNRRVAITYGDEQVGGLTPVPNPASPDKSKVGNSNEAKNPTTNKPAGTDAHKFIGAFHNPQAIEHIRNGGGGAVFRVSGIYVPQNSAGNGPGAIKCQVKVYDLAGNLVSSGKEENIFSASRQEAVSDRAGNYADMDLFWSGFNSKGMKAAPGTYRIVVMISYPGSSDPLAKNKKLTGTVGIAK